MAARMRGLYYAASATVAIAGVLHLIIATNVLGFSLSIGTFFIVAGIAQLFWVVPMIRRLGQPWYYGGIGGTAVLIILFVITRMPGNPITGRGQEINPLGIVVELLEAAFIGLTASIIVRESRLKEIGEKKDKKLTPRQHNPSQLYFWFWCKQGVYGFKSVAIATSCLLQCRAFSNVRQLMVSGNQLTKLFFCYKLALWFKFLL